MAELASSGYASNIEYAVRGSTNTIKSMDDTISHLVATGPRHVQRILQLTTNHDLHEQYAKVKRNPKHIKRLPIEQAILVTELVDDPEQLGRIIAADKRERVIDAAQGHTLWSQVPHRFRCRICTTDTIENITTCDQLMNLTKWREPASSASRFCSEQILNTILTMPAEEQQNSWPEAFENGLRYNARALVAIAAGRIRLDLDGDPRLSYARADGDVDELEKALEAEPVATKALVAFGLLFSYIPGHWKLDDDDWGMVLTKNDARLLQMVHPPVETILRNWSSLNIASKISILNRTKSMTELSQILTLVKPDADEIAKERYTKVKQHCLLQRFPEITLTEKLLLLGLGGRKTIALYLVGGFAEVGPRAADMPDSVNAYIDYYTDHPNQLTSEAVRDSDDAYLTELLSKNCQDIRVPAQKILVDELLAKLPAKSLFNHEGILSDAAHRMLWTSVKGDENIMTATSLLQDWSGTLQEMIASLQKLNT